mmetsp:Transcript_15967/g.62376  ORF Transcript_15967/g.62376 Transcript_15967/m.62376 type:complete len:225 (-) Transcript_15967:1270-1944(-)
MRLRTVSTLDATSAASASSSLMRLSILSSSLEMNFFSFVSLFVSCFSSRASSSFSSIISTATCLSISWRSPSGRLLAMRSSSAAFSRAISMSFSSICASMISSAISSAFSRNSDLLRSSRRFRLPSCFVSSSRDVSAASLATAPVMALSWAEENVTELCAMSVLLWIQSSSCCRSTSFLVCSSSSSSSLISSASLRSTSSFNAPFSKPTSATLTRISSTSLLGR